MRGIMFNYLLSCIEKHYGYEIVDNIIIRSKVINDGAYANGKLYNDEEFVTLIKTASNILNMSPSEMQVRCGKDIFKDIFEKLVTLYDPHTHKYNKFTNAFDFISKLEIIHFKEVAKLYPDSEFPHFDVISHDDIKIEIRYRSKRNLPYLAKGFLEGCIVYFDEPLSLQMVEDENSNGTRFIIEKESK